MDRLAILLGELDQIRAENKRLFKIIEQVCDASEQWQGRAEKADAEVQRLRAAWEDGEEAVDPVRETCQRKRREVV